MKKIRIGLVGCGRISKFHLDALRTLSSTYEIVAVADTIETRAQEAAGIVQCKSYASLQQMLDAESLDLVTLTTPSGLHPAQAKICADAGVACLSEKPFGCFYEEAKEVVEYFEERKVPLFVVHQNRFNPTIQKVRNWFDAGKFGKMYLIQTNVFWQRPQSYYDAESWRGRREMDGGAFMNQASHYVDLTQWFGGDVLSVKSELDTFGRSIECEDTGAALLRFKSGAIGVMSVTMLTYPENQEGSITLLGEKASVKVSGKALNKLEICRGKDIETPSELDAVNYEPSTIYGNGHGEYYQRLSQVLLGASSIADAQVVDGREGLKSLKVICDIYWERDHV